MTVRLQSPFEEPIRLVLLGRDQPDDVLVESPGGNFCVEIRSEPVLVFLVGEFTDLS